MFLEFYNLRQQPFGVTPDPAYLYRTRTHREALSSLLSGIKDGRGFFALIAEPGMGKTTLLYQLLDELHDCARTVFLFQTQCSSREFFQYLLNELGVDTRGMDLVSMHSKLNEILFAEMIAGRRFVLIVDEAQNLEDSVLETVRRVYESYGFSPLETPAFEYTDALGKFLPDVDRPNEGVFSLKDDDGEWLSLEVRDVTALEKAYALVLAASPSSTACNAPAATQVSTTCSRTAEASRK